jgi:hypothetical protein
MNDDDQELIDSSDENQLADEVDAAAELSGLRDESATLADSELEDEANLPMEGQAFHLEDVLPFSRSMRGDAGYDQDED